MDCLQPARRQEICGRYRRKIPIGVSREQIHRVLVEIQQDFPGAILQEWGNRWFSIDFLDQEESDMLAEMEAEMEN